MARTATYNCEEKHTNNHTHTDSQAHARTHTHVHNIDIGMWVLYVKDICQKNTTQLRKKVNRKLMRARVHKYTHMHRDTHTHAHTLTHKRKHTHQHTHIWNTCTEIETAIATSTATTTEKEKEKKKEKEKETDTPCTLTHAVGVIFLHFHTYLALDSHVCTTCDFHHSFLLYLVIVRFTSWFICLITQIFHTLHPHMYKHSRAPTHVFANRAFHISVFFDLHVPTDLSRIFFAHLHTGLYGHARTRTRIRAIHHPWESS